MNKKPLTNGVKRLIAVFLVTCIGGMVFFVARNYCFAKAWGELQRRGTAADGDLLIHLERVMNYIDAYAQEEAKATELEAYLYSNMSLCEKEMNDLMDCCNNYCSLRSQYPFFRNEVIRQREIVPLSYMYEEKLTTGFRILNTFFERCIQQNAAEEHYEEARACFLEAKEELLVVYNALKKSEYDKAESAKELVIRMNQMLREIHVETLDYCTQFADYSFVE